jgi:DNA-binding IclR family transcriptional regulator
MELARRHKSQEERDRYDERRLNWFLRAQEHALSGQELTAISGMPTSRVLAALDRLSDDGVIRSDDSNRWRISRRNDNEVAS